jgi:acetaldehyde dehydrogenase (acetylating)
MLQHQRSSDYWLTNSRLGQCYPRETLVWLLHLCTSKGIHLISDEIYALSVFNREDRQAESFTSVRAIDLTGIIDPGHVHVLYGMSKVSDDALSPLNSSCDAATRILLQTGCG